MGESRKLDTSCRDSKREKATHKDLKDTYPLEIIQLQQWLAALPDAVKQLAENVDYRLGKRLSCATERCNGRCATYAREGEGCREFEV
jgi:hypothetical protein